MTYPKFGNEEPMSAAEASLLVRKMIHLEGSGPGETERAMRKIARTYKISFWTLDHFRKNKAKTCDVSLFARIQAAFIDHCRNHAARLLHDAEMAAASGRPANDVLENIQDQIRALAAQLEAAKGQKNEVTE